MKRLICLFFVFHVFTLSSQINCDSINNLLNNSDLQEASKCKLLIESGKCCLSTDRKMALQRFFEAQQLATKFSYFGLMSQAQCAIANIYYEDGKINECKKYAEFALQASESDPSDFEGKINSRKILAKVVFLTGDFTKSTGLIKDAIELAEKSKTQTMASECKLLLANFYVSAGKFNEADSIYKSALEKVKDLKTESTILSNMGTLHLKRNDTIAANRSFKLALNLKRKIGDKKGEFLVLYQIALLLFGQKRYEASLKTIDLCKVLAHDIGNPIMEGDAYKAAFLINKEKRDQRAAASQLELAIEKYKKGQEKSELLEAYSAAEQFYKQTGDNLKSEESKRQAMALRDSINTVLKQQTSQERQIVNKDLSDEITTRNLLRLGFVVVVACVGIFVLFLKRKK